ncbi:CREB-regulated transcription coactivator 3 isoform X2 [Hermetia illucens]|uniref:CREB-regulated transcription coactivator 3 isoform X2 n=1 Tax=Hermetia illucens TaxID=343691 RepID=UPI0018CBF21D|nr:CREB-regulated transcription coactivator 3 isoform X2 [Hermetia illucens]
MANPRKFSEKIALQKQKQAEGTAEFEKIMREVSDATSKQDDPNYSQRFAESGIQNKTNNSASPSINVSRESRGRSVGLGPMRRPSERKNDRSPYGSSTTAYLSPPNDSYWRRASSDSAIHQSLIQTPEKHHGSHSPISLSPTAQRRAVHINQNTDSRHFLNNSGSRHLSNVDVRQTSPVSLSRVPSVNPYPSSHDGSLSTPIGNNTGSLPDLTSVHFAPPLNTPLDKEQEHSSSPYSSSPITTSPTALSPTSMPNRYQYSPAHSPSDSNTYSPTHFSSNARQNFLTVPGSHNSTHHFSSKEGQFDNLYNPSDIGQTTHLSFTNLPGLIHVRNSNISNNNVLHSSHGNLTSIGMAPANMTEYRNPQCRPSPGSSPGLIPNIPTSDSNPSAPCSPVPQNPSSSSSSQTYDSYQSQNNDGYNLNQSFQNHITLDWATLFQSLLESGCTWTAQVQVDNTTQDYLPNIQSSQNNFGSIQFDDTAFAQLGSLSNTTSHQHQQQTQPQQHQQSQQQQQPQQLQQVNRNNYNTQQQEMNTNKNDANCTTPTNSRYATNSNLIPQNSQNMTGDQQNSHLHNNYQTANTPTSIPEIVFSDFSTANSDFSREIFSSLDLELGPMDMAGMQMLHDPNATMIADPTIEDSFRRDLN